jgi:hypothetical protein
MSRWTRPWPALSRSVSGHDSARRLTQKPKWRHYLSSAASAPASQIPTAETLHYSEHRPKTSRPRIFDCLPVLTIDAVPTQLALNFKRHLNDPALDLSDDSFAVS